MTLQVLALLPYTYLPSGILIVEPHEGLLAARSMLLGAAGRNADLPVVSELQGSGECNVAFALLSESLGYAVLSQTARLIRKNWPRARILIIGRSRAAIDDQLYDARIEQPPRPEELLAALLMLAEYPRNQCATPPAIITDDRIGRLLNGTGAPAKDESDPTKRLTSTVPTAHPGDRPAKSSSARRRNESSAREHLR